MSNLPAIPEIIDQLRMHIKKQSYSNATCATNLNLFAAGWGWTEGHVEALMEGRVQPTALEIEFLELYLLQRFYDYNCTA